MLLNTIITFELEAVCLETHELTGQYFRSANLQLQRVDHTYHHPLLITLSLTADLNVLVRMRGISYESTLCSYGHFLDHRVCRGGEQEPVYAVEARDNRQEIRPLILS